MRKVQVRFAQLANFKKKKDVEKAEKARLLIEKTINDKSFHDKVTSAKFEDRRFRDRSGTTHQIEDNTEILERLLIGNEQYGERNSDYEWDLKIVLFRSLANEIGHRNRDTIFTKKKQFRQMTTERVAAHWIHEYAHVIGFTHDHEVTKIRPNSVPYAVGSISRKIMES